MTNTWIVQSLSSENHNTDSAYFSLKFDIRIGSQTPSCIYIFFEVHSCIYTCMPLPHIEANDGKQRKW